MRGASITLLLFVTCKQRKQFNSIETLWTYFMAFDSDASNYNNTQRYQFKIYGWISFQFDLFKWANF